MRCEWIVTKKNGNDARATEATPIDVLSERIEGWLQTKDLALQTITLPK